MVSSLGTVAEAVAQWRGAVFVKGSRRYQLENVFEPGAPVHAHA
jgi:UDP-N-acetylmuramoyl-tripeptide--D-alanyl-D-alanine ligase